MDILPPPLPVQPPPQSGAPIMARDGRDGPQALGTSLLQSATRALPAAG